MARSLTRLSQSLSSTTTTRLTIFRRNQSSPPENRFSDAMETDKPKKSPEDLEMERLALRKLEDAVHRIIVKKSEPNWLPLVPGASYWVPPKKKAHGFAQVIGKLANDSRNDNKGFSLSSKRGWPSNANFFKGASHSPLEGETASKHTSQSEDEEV